MKKLTTILVLIIIISSLAGCISDEEKKDKIPSYNLLLEPGNCNTWFDEEYVTFKDTTEIRKGEIKMYGYPGSKEAQNREAREIKLETLIRNKGGEHITDYEYKFTIPEKWIVTEVTDNLDDDSAGVPPNLPNIFIRFSIYPEGGRRHLGFDTDYDGFADIWEIGSSNILHTEKNEGIADDGYPIIYSDGCKEGDYKVKVTFSGKVKNKPVSSSMTFIIELEEVWY